jgi:hypothetical protein
VISCTDSTVVNVCGSDALALSMTYAGGGVSLRVAIACADSTVVAGSSVERKSGG